MDHGTAESEYRQTNDDGDAAGSAQLHPESDDADYLKAALDRAWERLE